MDQLRGHSITYRIALGPQQSRKVFTLQTLPVERDIECPYMDSSSFASKLYLADMARLHTYIRPLKLAYVY